MKHVCQLQGLCPGNEVFLTNIKEFVRQQYENTIIHFYKI
jgi:hypothetical protein